MARISNIRRNGLSEAERLELATLLIKAGYTVKLGAEKKFGTSTVEHYIEYEAAQCE